MSQKRETVKMNTQHMCHLDKASKRKHGNKCTDFWKRAIHISTNNPRTKFFFRSFSSVEGEKTRHLRSRNTVAIHPLSMFRLYYEIFYMVVFFFDIVITPYFIVITPQLGTMSIYEAIMNSLRWCDLQCCLLSFIDMAFSLNTGICVPSVKRVILRKRSVTKAYMKRKDFYIDFYCSIPVDLIFNCLATKFEFIKSSVGVHLMIDLISCIKIFRIYKFLLFYENTMELLVHHYYYIMFTKYFVIVNIFLNWLISLYLIIGIYSTFDTQDVDYSVYSGETATLFDYNYLTTFCKSTFYVASYLLGISLVNGHRQDVHFLPLTTHDIILFIVYSIFGCIGCNLLLILIMQMVLSMNSTESKYYAILSQVHMYMKHENLPSAMVGRIVTYYDYRFQKKYFREASILSILSESLRRDINMHCCRTLIEGVTLLRELPLDILSHIVVHLKQELFLYNDVIFKAGSLGDSMYFIANGTVAIYTQNGGEICHLQDGSYFGEIALIAPNQRRVANVVAIEICEVYRLDRRNFKNSFPPSSPHYKKLEQVAQERSEKTLLLEELHQKYLLENKTRLQADLVVVPKQSNKPISANNSISNNFN